MNITEAHLTWIFGCLLLLGLLLAYPALTTAIALLRAQQSLGKLFWHVVSAFDRQRRADAIDAACTETDSCLSALYRPATDYKELKDAATTRPIKTT